MAVEAKAVLFDVLHEFPGTNAASGATVLAGQAKAVCCPNLVLRGLSWR